MAQRRKRSAVDRALFHMRPGRVAARFISGGRHQTFGSIAKSPFKSKTVHTPKSGRRAYQQAMARERKVRAAEAAKQRKQAAVEQKAARAQQRAQQPRAPRQQRQQAPVMLSPLTGKPITYREALASSRRAEREADRILTGKPARAPRAPKPTAPKTPLQVAIEEVQKKQGAKKPAAKPKPAKKKAAKPRRRVQPLAPVFAGSPAPKVQRPGRTVSGVVMAATCSCQGTGRVIVNSADGSPNGSVSCPTHGRSGKARGQKRWTMRAAIRDSGLPGLSGRLQRKHTARRGNSDQRQAKAADITRRETRLAGPTLPCEWCQGGISIPDRKMIERLRADYISNTLAAVPEGEKPPSKRKLEKSARLAWPHILCSHCKGLGRVETNATLLPDGQQPVAEWRATAGLKKGHRPTGREQATGKKGTKNARRVERNQKLPRF